MRSFNKCWFGGLCCNAVCSNALHTWVALLGLNWSSFWAGSLIYPTKKRRKCWEIDTLPYCTEHWLKNWKPSLKYTPNAVYWVIRVLQKTARVFFLPICCPIVNQRKLFEEILHVHKRLNQDVNPKASPTITLQEFYSEKLLPIFGAKFKLENFCNFLFSETFYKSKPKLNPLYTPLKTYEPLPLPESQTAYTLVPVVKQCSPPTPKKQSPVAQTSAQNSVGHGAKNFVPPYSTQPLGPSTYGYPFRFPHLEPYMQESPTNTQGLPLRPVYGGSLPTANNELLIRQYYSTQLLGTQRFNPVFRVSFKEAPSSNLPSEHKRFHSYNGDGSEHPASPQKWLYITFNSVWYFSLDSLVLEQITQKPQSFSYSQELEVDRN